MNKRPRAHHIVARSYLKQFATGAGKKARLHVYERNRAEPWTQHPDSVAIQTNFYSFRNDDGTFNDSVEELLAMAESRAMPVIKRVATEQFQPSTEERLAVGWFMAFQEFRVPGMREMLDHSYINMMKRTLEVAANVPGYLERICTEVQPEAGEGESAEEMREWIRNDFVGYKLSVDPHNSLSTMTNLATRLAPYYARMDWTILRMPDSEPLITTDNPILKCNTNPDKSNFYGRLLGITNRFIEVWLPLSRSALLVVDHNYEHFEQWAKLTEEGRGEEAKEMMRSAGPKTTFDSVPARRAP